MCFKTSVAAPVAPGAASPAPHTGAFHRQRQCPRCPGRCPREADADGRPRGSEVARVRLGQLKGPGPRKQNVCCVKRPAEINEPVCSGRLPLIINGTADFGPDRRPYDLSTCILAPHNVTPHHPAPPLPITKHKRLTLSCFAFVQSSYSTTIWLLTRL